MENTLEVIEKWCSDNHLIAIGLIFLIAAFILSFSCKTAWGEWKRRR